MRGFDRDLIRGGHYGQRSCEPHKQAEHMAAPTSLRREESPCQPGAVHTWHDDGERYASCGLCRSLRCHGTDRGVVEIRDGRFYDGEPAWFSDAKRPDGFYWFYVTADHRIKNGRLCADHTRASRPRRRLP